MRGITIKGAMSVVAFDDVPCWSTKTTKKQDEEPTKKSGSEGTQKEPKTAKKQDEEPTKKSDSKGTQSPAQVRKRRRLRRRSLSLQRRGLISLEIQRRKGPPYQTPQIP